MNQKSIVADYYELVMFLFITLCNLIWVHLIEITSCYNTKATVAMPNKELSLSILILLTVDLFKPSKGT